MRRVGGAETRRNILVDGNNLIHRAYFAYVESRVREGLAPLCTSGRAPKGGYPTGVIYGSLAMLSSWLYDINNPTRICVFFDGVPKRRLDLDPNYKGDRDFAERGLNLSDPSGTGIRHPRKLLDGYEADCEIDVLAHVFSLLGCDVFHHPEEEADDLVASFVKAHPDELHVVISDDKDFFQLLVNPRVVVFRPGSKDDRFFDAEKATNHWAKFQKGSHPPVPVSQVRMFKSLCGDSSDSIIGIERLRKKVALPLCHLSSVDEVYASGFPGWSKSEKEKALFLRERIRINYELVGFHEDIPLDPCLRKVAADFATAKLVLRDDLDITAVDLRPFRLGAAEPPAPVLPDIEPWLADI